jgi:hypothetical protein
MRPDIAPGGTFPDYELRSHERLAWEAGDLSAFHGWNRWSPERVAAARSAS